MVRNLGEVLIQPLPTILAYVNERVTSVAEYHNCTTFHSKIIKKYILTYPMLEISGKFGKVSAKVPKSFKMAEGIL